MRLHSYLLLCAGLAGPLTVSAQVLPSKPTEGGSIAPYVSCSTCQTRSYTYPSNAPRDEAGRIVTWCAQCKQDRPHTASFNQDPGLPSSNAGTSTRSGDLKLRPRSTPSPAAPTPPTATTNPPAQAPKVEPTPSAAVDPAASFVFQGLRRSRGLDERLMSQAVASLSAMGPAGLAAARAELGAKEANVVIVAGRVLLASEQASDHELVLQCLRLQPPLGAGAALLAELSRVDPVRASTRALLEFLDAKEPGLRLQAAREVRKRLDASLLPELEQALQGARADARMELISLIGDLDTSAATQALVAHLADPAPRVALGVLAELAGRKDEGLDALLVAQAFGQRWVLRTQAYALLAIMEREDLGQRAILNDTHTQALLESLESQDPFVSGSCAAALAGIGFRSTRSDTRLWLDQNVVDRLVGVASGKVFHNDFVALQAPVNRRLKLITGQDVSEGPRWVSWWVNSRAGFRAQRASLAVGEGETARLALSFHSEGTHWVFLGPAEAEPANLAAGADVFRLRLEEAQALLSVLEREGLLGVERLPGLRGARGSRERTLVLSIAGRSKQFVLGPGIEETWFERSVAALRSVAEHNRWQLYPTPGKHAGRAELWAEQSQWWSTTSDALARTQALKKLVLAYLAQSKPGQASAGAFEELQRIYREHPQAAQPDDFRQLIALMRRAPSPSELAALVRMATVAAQSFDPQSREVPREMAHELVQSLDDLSLLEVVCDAAPLAFSRSLLGETRPELRAAAARALAKKGGPEMVEVLLPLLADKNPAVEAAAAEGLGRLKAEKARTELLVRARLGLEPVRVAALKAVGQLGGEFVLDALLLGLADRNPAVRAAAVEGMGSLDDPATAPFLIGLLAEGNSSAIYAPARSAVLKLGLRARTDLERVAASPTHRARLEAALVLAELCEPGAVPALLGALTLEPRDARLALELCILTCIDLRGEPDPASAWWEWWDGVVHDDAQAWLRAAGERLGLTPLAAEALIVPGTEAGRALCLELMRRPESWLAERGRREWMRLTGETLDALPPAGAAREAWIEALSQRTRRNL